MLINTFKDSSILLLDSCVDCVDSVIDFMNEIFDSVRDLSKSPTPTPGVCSPGPPAPRDCVAAPERSVVVRGSMTAVVVHVPADVASEADGARRRGAVPGGDTRGRSPTGGAAATAAVGGARLSSSSVRRWAPEVKAGGVVVTLPSEVTFARLALALDLRGLDLHVHSNLQMMHVRIQLRKMRPPNTPPVT